MGEPSHLRMARTGGAVGLGFDLEPPPPVAAAPKMTSAAALPKMQKAPENEVVFIDEDDVKYEVVKDEASAKDQAGLIRAATLERLVERLTHEKISDPKFRKAFLLTYRSFTTPLQLIEALLIRYDPTSLMKTEEITTKRVRVVGVIKAWMEDHFYDFNEPEVQQALTSFFDSMVLTMENSAKQLRRVFEKAKERNMDEEKLKSSRVGQESADPAKEEQFQKILAKGWKGLDTKDLAEQMTLLESDIYCAILPKECISWNKKEKELLAPNISAMIKQFNLFSNWVSCALVTQACKDDRVETLKKFIDLLDELCALNNFNGMMEVLSGINSSSVRRMKKTFEGLDAEYSKKFQKHEDLLSHKFSYKVYRENLHKINPPCVPYMGVYLTDLTFLSDGNPDNVDGGLINFKKRRLIAEVIDEIQQYQVRYLKYERINCVQKWLITLQNMDDDTMYKWSRRVEPKDNEAIIEELIKSEESLTKQISEYEAKIKYLEEAIRKEEEKLAGAGAGQ